MRFLNSMHPAWNITLFHYRNQGADYGRILVGLVVPPKDDKALAGVPRQACVSLGRRDGQPGLQTVSLSPHARWRLLPPEGAGRERPDGAGSAAPLDCWWMFERQRRERRGIPCEQDACRGARRTLVRRSLECRVDVRTACRLERGSRSTRGTAYQWFGSSRRMRRRPSSREMMAACSRSRRMLPAISLRAAQPLRQVDLGQGLAHHARAVELGLGDGVQPALQAAIGIVERVLAGCERRHARALDHLGDEIEARTAGRSPMYCCNVARST